MLTVEIPPLRERPDDIPVLAMHFLQEIIKKSGLQKNFDPQVLNCFLTYRWPGNVRELRNVIDRAAIICEGSEILPQHLPEYIQAYRKSSTLESSDGYYHYEIACLERQLITKALRDNGGNRQAAARQLGIHRSLLYKKMKDLGIHE